MVGTCRRSPCYVMTCSEIKYRDLQWNQNVLAHCNLQCLNCIKNQTLCWWTTEGLKICQSHFLTSLQHWTTCSYRVCLDCHVVYHCTGLFRPSTSLSLDLRCFLMAPNPMLIVFRHAPSSALILLSDGLFPSAHRSSSQPLSSGWMWHLLRLHTPQIMAILVVMKTQVEFLLLQENINTLYYNI